MNTHYLSGMTLTAAELLEYTCYRLFHINFLFSLISEILYEWNVHVLLRAWINTRRNLSSNDKYGVVLSIHI